ncbi:hypothetical protein GW915_12610 [bacterium]|nr:hypothetical protein [bacterium]
MLRLPRNLFTLSPKAVALTAILSAYHLEARPEWNFLKCSTYLWANNHLKNDPNESLKEILKRVRYIDEINVDTRDEFNSFKLSVLELSQFRTLTQSERIAAIPALKSNLSKAGWSKDEIAELVKIARAGASKEDIRFFLEPLTAEYITASVDYRRALSIVLSPLETINPESLTAENKKAHADAIAMLGRVRRLITTIEEARNSELN